MLDDLLGRSELKTRIDELAADRDRLENRLEAEQERRREAVRDRQDADERGNRLEDRITELEDRVTRLQDDDSDLEFRGVEALRGVRLREVLDRLESLRTAEEGLFTAMIDTEVPAAARDAFGDRAALLGRAAPCLAVTDDADLVSVALSPSTRPEPFTAWSDAVEIDRSWFLPTDEFALALVRSDLFAIGEYRDGERLSVTGFESEVNGNHSKGGFSQGRFERRRDARIEAHLDRCREVIDDRSASRLIVVGERTVLPAVADGAIETRAVDATGDPEDALADAFRQFFTARLYRF